MATELRPGMMVELSVRVAAEGNRRAGTALEQVARVFERRAKHNAGAGGSHKYGTKTPARPGGPPALISGTLRRSITHAPVTFTGVGWTTRIGVTAGVYPPYGKARTPASRYGFFLETGTGNRRYPWLLPAFKDPVQTVLFAYTGEFRVHWPHLL